MAYKNAKNGMKQHFCLRCFQSFQTSEKLVKHKERCVPPGVDSHTPIDVFPHPDGDNPRHRKDYVTFDAYQKQLPADVVIYADFESCILPGDSERLHGKHKAIAAHFNAVYSDGTSEASEVFYGDTPEDVIDRLLEGLRSTAYSMDKKLQKFKEHALTADEKRQHAAAEECYLCGGSFAARPGSQDPKSSEKYSTVTWRVGGNGLSIQFKDSTMFLLDSLDKLVKMQGGNLPLAKAFWSKRGKGEEQIQLLLRKGVYPYRWTDNPAKLEHTQLPPIEAFRNDLTGDACKPEEYAHAQNVWRVLLCRTVRDYMELYLLSDVMLLSDVFENFRKSSLTIYQLDPAHYISAPGLFYDAALRMGGETLALFTREQRDMYYFCEKPRGGVCSINHRYAKANNPYLPDYDSGQPTSYISYVDATGLYATAMLEKLPVDQYRWEPEGFDHAAMDLEGERGGFGEFDFDYPEELHDAHNMFPLAAEHLQLTRDMLSPLTKQQRGDTRAPLGNKLVPNLLAKKNYICDLRLARQYVELGMKITTVHRILTFRQVAWLKPFIEFNFAKRGGGFPRREHLLPNVKSLRRHIAKPTFKNYYPFKQCESLTGVEMHQMHVFLNKPIAVGLAIVELSKRIMYDYHYGYMLPRYGADRLKLLFTDTDSLTYLVQTEDIYKDMGESVESRARFDTSSFPKAHFLYSKANEKKPHTMTDEAKGNPIGACHLAHWCPGLGKESKESKLCKGVKRSCVRRDLSLANYKECLATQKPQERGFNTIRSHQHELYIEHVNKVALSSIDDKRYQLDGIATLAYGHYRIAEIEAAAEAIENVN
ncbi:hypothetical protein WJX72_001210 [[Myrmecia] bisecta]|uniref:DNA-directed DNA polymerase n=1 Tax=[Myrmecia] bisecta TaxID=41462 RepID=A0AAW1Q0D4_9CHLO